MSKVELTTGKSSTALTVTEKLVCTVSLLAVPVKVITASPDSFSR